MPTRSFARIMALVAVALAAALSRGAGAQLLTIAYDAGTERLYDLSPADGSLSEIGVVASCCAISGSVSTADVLGRRIFFVDVTSGAKIFTVDTTSGAVLNNPSLPAGNNYEFLEYDRSTATLYTVYRTGVDFHLGTVNPVTGAISNASATFSSCCSTWSGGQSALGNGTFYFIAGSTSSSDHKLWKVALSTGTATNVALPPGGGTGNQYQFLHRDPHSGTLYLVYRPFGGVSKLATIDPATGSVTNVGAGSGIAGCCNAPAGDLSGVDPGAGFFRFVGTNDSNSTRRLFDFALATGTAGTPHALAGSINYNFLEALHLLFQDGFESNNTSSWSAAVP